MWVCRASRYQQTADRSHLPLIKTIPSSPPSPPSCCCLVSFCAAAVVAASSILAPREGTWQPQVPAASLAAAGQDSVPVCVCLRCVCVCVSENEDEGEEAWCALV